MGNKLCGGQTTGEKMSLVSKSEHEEMSELLNGKYSSPVLQCEYKIFYFFISGV